MNARSDVPDDVPAATRMRVAASVGDAHAGTPKPRKQRPFTARATAVAFGQRVADYREAQQLSQGTLAARAQLSQAGLSHIEAGTRTPSIETARLLAAALGVGVGALMGERSAAVIGEEAEFLNAWRAAPSPVRAQVADYLAFLTARRAADRPERPRSPRPTR